MGVACYPSLFLAHEEKWRLAGNGYGHVKALEQEIGAILTAK
jgi:hypothetical protein